MTSPRAVFDARGRLLWITAPRAWSHARIMAWARNVADGLRRALG